MNTKYSLTHLADSTLLRELASLVAQDRCTTAAMLAHIAEFDARRLYAPAGYPTTFAYCVGELRLSENATFKRTQAARAASRFPMLFEALESGELNLSAINLLAPHLTHGNARELIQAASGRCNKEIVELLAARFPRPELPEMVRAIDPPAISPAVPQVESRNSLSECTPELAAQAPAPDPAPHFDDVPTERAKTTPVSAERFGLQLTMDRSTHDKLRHAQDLLGHQMRSGDLAGLFDRALDALIRELEKRKFAACSQPRDQRHRQARARASNPRKIPADVKRAVWERDGGQCTFVSSRGHRCGCRRNLQFDHIIPVARGGKSEVPNLRLRCSAHNQYEAELVFGAGFMQEKRARVRESAVRAARPDSSAELRSRAGVSPAAPC